jgi:hypothetical protein
MGNGCSLFHYHFYEQKRHIGEKKVMLDHSFLKLKILKNSIFATGLKNYF